MADRIALWGRDIDEPADVDNGHLGNGQHDPITEPIPVVEAEYAASDDSDDSDEYEARDVADDAPTGYIEERSDDLDDESSHVEEDTRAVSDVEPVIVRSNASAGSTLTFKPAHAPWYRTRRGLIVLIAVIAVAVVLALLPMLLRSPAPGSEDSTNVTPTTAPAPSSVQPTNSVVPTLTNRPAPPPPPAAPPPPPPAPPAPDAPVYTRQYQPPRYSEPEPSKPEIGVTRAPISVAPKPVTPPTGADVGAHGDNSGGSPW